MPPGWSGWSARGKQLLRCGKTAQLMATERHDAVERRSQFCTDDDRLAEHLGRILDAAHQIDRGPDYGEIEPVGGADIAVMDCADMQRDDDVERRLAAHRRVIGKAGDGGDRLARCGDGGFRDHCNRVGPVDRKDGEQAIADEFENFATMPARLRPPVSTTSATRSSSTTAARFRAGQPLCNLVDKARWF
jgi:hypothetical protein